MMPSNDDARLFASLRQLWEERDPMPEGLVEDVLVALETHRLADEYRELLLVSDEHTLAGVRGEAPRILQFGAQAITLMLRIDTDGDRHRIDGWLAPPRAGRVVLEIDGVEHASVPISAEGRFEFAEVPSGSCRLAIHPADEDGHSVTGEFRV
ncbi:hypothetical protein [Protaetiibacter larvae]|uniref:Carboxypeptidase regulatory-like domain-containing protein n=1 Tax=Protaetiibacter larvae TaxID=2592654 RepID=A0A5C1Y678_9MICO|nr:hypothetical protein [Protaetiibacter larvae]QEO08809.1 hypothetical protein FLP23_01510 [Protaetiibacter larvae]